MINSDTERDHSFPERQNRKNVPKAVNTGKCIGSHQFVFTAACCSVVTAPPVGQLQTAAGLVQGAEGCPVSAQHLKLTARRFAC